MDRFESLVAALDEIYLRKHEPAVRGVRDELVEPKNIAMLCFLADVLKSTNTFQTVLQENEQQMKLSQAEVNLKNNEKTLKTIASLLSDRRRLTIKNNIKKLEKEIESLKKIFVILLRPPQKNWFEASLSVRHKDISIILELAGLIPPSTAEVECWFSLMKLICTKFRKSMTAQTLSNCMRICKFRQLTDSHAI